MTSTLLAYSDDGTMAQRSGYHVLGDYLTAERIVTKRSDPPDGLPLLLTRIKRRLSFSRWCTGGSFELEREIRTRLQSGFRGILHYLWCDRDFAFLDLCKIPRGVHLVGTFHHPAEQLDSIVRRKSALQKFEAVITMSEQQRPWFRNHGVDDSRIHTVPHGVDTEFFCPDKTMPPRKIRQIALAVGSTGRDFAMLRSVATELRQDSHIEMQIIGPSWQSSQFAQLPHVSFRTQVSDHELLDAYRSATCLLHLVTTATANNVLLEAFACGTPAVTHRVGGIPEYVNQKCALMAEPTDVGQITASIRQLADDPDLRERMSQAARAQAVSLSWPVIAARTQAIYDSLGRRSPDLSHA